MTSARGLARILFLDQWRRPVVRRTLVASVLGAVAVMLILGVAEGAAGQAERTPRQVVARSADLDRARALLEHSQLDVTAAADPEATLAARDAHLAIAFRGDEPVLTFDPTRESSLEAYGRAHAAATADQQGDRLIVDDLPAPRRYERGQMLALLAGLLLTSSVAGSASSLVTGRAGSPAEVVLATPVRRAAIAVGVAAGAAPTTAIQIGAYLVAGTAAVVASIGGAGLDLVSVLVALGIAAVGLIALGCAIAALSAGVARSHQQAAAVTGVGAMVVSIGSFTLIAVPHLTSAGPAAWVPGLGPQLVIRDAMYGAVPWSTLLSLLGTAAVVVVIAIGVSARLLATDGRSRRA
jgi:hypothetical protein